MPTRRGNGVFYVKRTFPGVGSVYRTLGTKRKGRATVREAALGSLHRQGRYELLRMFGEGSLSIQEIEEACEAGKVHELSERVRRNEVPLAQACKEALILKSPDVAGSTLDRYATGLGHFRRFVGEEKTVREVLTEDTIQAFKAQRLKDGASKQTWNKDAIAVSILVTLALKRKWIEERPTIKRFPHKERIRWLDPGQLASYMASLRPAFRTQQQLLVGTGMRLGESEALRACDLRLGNDDSRAMVTDSKTSAGVRTVFVPTWVADSLRLHIEEEGLRGTDRLFTIKRRTVQGEHPRACRIAGISDYRIHDHRHTCAVHLCKAGIPLNLLQQQLGHKHITMTMKYARFHPAYADVGGYFDAVGKTLGLGTGNKTGNTPNQEAQGVRV
ncbi:MAG: site-specific integrase [Gemmatimonadota bacterium]